MKIAAQHSEKTDCVSTGAFYEAVGVGLMWDAEVVSDTGDAHELLDAGLDDIGGVVGVDVLRYAEYGKRVQKGNDRLYSSFLLGGMEHDEA